MTRLFEQAERRVLERLTALLNHCLDILRCLHPSRRRQRAFLSTAYVIPIDQQEIAERIWCNLLSNAGRPDCDRVIRLAIQHLDEDLHSERGGEVLEDIRREIAFQTWCAEMARSRTLEAPLPKNPHNQPCKIQTKEL